ncbi:MAG: DNA-directed RNA polymerase subunit alpha C-terminal domain-containing protein [Planctomycetota bacterium]
MRILLAEPLDTEEILSLRHVAEQSTAERKELESMREKAPASLADRTEADLREAVLRWAIGEDPVALPGRHHPLVYMLQGHMALERGKKEAALAAFEKAARAAPTEAACVLAEVEALRELGRLDAALERIAALEREFSDRSEFHFQKGRVLEALFRHEEATASYEKALELEPNHFRAIFRLANLLDLRGNDEEALALYQRIGPGRNHAFINASLNMALIHEDRTDYEAAINCCLAVLRVDPNNHRARLFRRDTEESIRMYYSPEEAKETERLEAVLRVPVSDFELSVRSRNCLTKMNIRTLGDLVRKTEQEMLGYKNFGETSLREIKEMLVSRGLRLGMMREDAIGRVTIERSRPPVQASYEAMPIDELELSVRSRKCMDRLGIKTIGELLKRTESDLIGAKNFGRVSLQELKNKLTEKGLSLP